MTTRLILLAILSLEGSVAATESNHALRGTTPCELRKWHLAVEDTTHPRCSNSWKVPSWALHKPELFYESSETCCADLFEGQECDIFNACEPEKQFNDHCKHPKWHFDIDTKEGCTNSPRFPESWKDPHVVADYLFETHEECCDKFVKRGYPCSKHDVCAAFNK